MEFTFETQYDAKTMAVMAKALRKTIRKKHSRRSHIFGWLVVALGLLLVISKGLTFDFCTVITVIAVMVVFITLLFEDKINGFAASKHLLSGTDRAVTVFIETGYVSTTDIGKTEWGYDKIALIAEINDFFVFVFSANHAQLYDKRHLQGGTVDDFRCFIEKTTGKQVQKIK